MPTSISEVSQNLGLEPVSNGIHEDQSYKHSADLWRVFTAGTLNDEQSLIREVSRVDRRLVEMCKKELVTVEDVKDLAKRCRNTLLKYLAQRKREEDSASS